MQIMFHGAMKCVFATYAGLVGSTRSSITPLHNSANRRLYSTKNRIVHLDARNCVPGYTSTSRVNKRLYSTNDRKVRLNKGDCVPGFVLDIDGVLIRGDTVIPEAREAMDILTNTTLVAEDGSESKGFPYVFVTNGGGSTEQKKAHQLSEWLNIDVPVEKVILSHTPMRKYTNLYDKNVLLVGQGPLQEIAANYGYKNTWTMEDVVKAYPLLHVMDKSKKYDPATSTGELPPIDAVFVMIEPTHWEMNLQVLVDVLTSNKTIGEREHGNQAVPIWFTNPDFLWKAQHTHNRFGQGAFKLCLEALYEGYAGMPLKSSQFGKPHALTYEFALQALKTQMNDKTGLSLGKVYGVGDNPTSDIRGANNQASMSSVMVLTGVFNGADIRANDPTDPADHVVEHVLDAVKLATELN